MGEQPIDEKKFLEIIEVRKKCIGKEIVACKCGLLMTMILFSKKLWPSKKSMNEDAIEMVSQ